MDRGGTGSHLVIGVATLIDGHDNKQRAMLSIWLQLVQQRRSPSNVIDEFALRNGLGGIRIGKQFNVKKCEINFSGEFP
jgi:hypothetical protein